MKTEDATAENDKVSDEDGPKRRKFSTRLKTEEVEIDDKVYTLTELDGDKKVTYQNFMGQKFKLTDGGKSARIHDYDKIESKLIAMCLTDADGKGVREKQIDSWPATTVKGLYEICQEMNGFTESAAEKEKNS